MERILAAIRTQVLPGGNREVTLDLQRSVLEGLRIKLTADPRGRIGVEFLAGSEAVKGQVDARAGELVEMFRAHGVKLQTLQSSVSNTSTNSEGHNRQSREHQPATDLIDSKRRPAAPVTDDIDDGPEFYSNATYRA
jgi:flagellar hook-length control protein FliK